MKTKPWKEVRNERLSPAQKEQADAYARGLLAEMKLKELRRARNLTQVELAKLMEVSQPELSRLERVDNPQLGTIRRYVEAMGGQLEILARFGDDVIKIDDL